MAPKAKRLFSKEAICRATDYTGARFDRLEKFGVLKGTAIESIRNHVTVYDSLDALCVAVASQMLANKLPTAMAVDICLFLRSRTLRQLQAAWRAGRKYLMSVNGCRPLPQLLSYDAIFKNDGIDWKAAADQGTQVVVIDVCQAFANFEERVVQVTKRRPVDFLPDTPRVRAWKKAQQAKASTARKRRAKTP